MPSADWIPDWLSNLFNYEAFEQTPDASFKDIGLAVAVNGAVGACLFVYWTRKRWQDPAYFSPKRGDKPPDLPPPQKGMAAWLWTLVDIDEAQFLRYAGFDALIYVRMYLLAAKISAATAVYALCVVLPVNVVGDNLTDEEASANSFSLLSMSNVAPGSATLWVHAVGTLLMTIAAFFFLNGEFTTYTRLRHAYLKMRAPHMRTILLEDVPAEMRGAAQIYIYFNHLYPNSIASVACMQDLRPLRRLLEQRESTLARLERLLLRRARAAPNAAEPTMWTGPALAPCASCERVEAASWLQQRLDALNAAIGVEQSLRLQRLQLMDRRVLREVEAGGYLSSATFRPQAAFAATAQGGGGSDKEATAAYAASIEDYLVRLGGRLGFGDQDERGAESKGGEGEGAPLLDPFALDDSGDSASDGEGVSVRLQCGARRRRRRCCCASRRRLQRACARAGAAAGGAWGAVVKGCQRLSTELNSSIALDHEVTDDVEGISREERQALLPPAPTPHELRLTGMGPRAFVSFKTFAGATIARQVHHTNKVGRLRAYEAPEPRDVYWQNAHIRRATRLRRRVLVDAFLAVLYVFWVVPVTGLYLVFSTEALSAHSALLRDSCARDGWLCTALDSVQPVMLLALMNALPPLIRALGVAEGSAAESWNQKVALSRYFYFQVINVFLVTTIAGTVFDTLSLIVDSPSKALTLLGESLPKMCGFFCEYVLIKMLSGLWIELSRLFSLLQHCALVCVWPMATRRDRRAVVAGMRRYDDPGWFNYPKYLAQDLLVVVVTFTFACINPFILVVSIPYYLAAHLTYKHQMLYVYEPVYETGGTFFPKVFRRFIFAIFTAQATMAGVLILKTAYYQAAAVVLLMVATWAFKSQQRGYFEPVSNALPLEVATVLDMESEVPREGPLLDEMSNPYMQPELTAKAVVQPEPQ